MSIRVLNNQGCPHGCNAAGKYLFKGEWYPCPIHGIQKETILNSGILPDGSSIYDVLRIPEEYKDEFVDNIDRLFDKEEGLKYCTLDSIRSVKSILLTLYNMITVDKSLYPCSLYIYSSMVDLKPWVYTLQRYAIEEGLSVLPLTTVNEISGIVALQDYPAYQIRDAKDISIINKLNRVAAIGADWYLQTGLSYVDYLRASLVFIYDDGASSINNLKVFGGFLEERARRGLPTYVISTVFLNDNRLFLINEKGEKTRRLSKLTPYQIISKRYAGKTSSYNMLLNPQVQDLDGVVGEAVEGHGIDYFDD